MAYCLYIRANFIAVLLWLRMRISVDLDKNMKINRLLKLPCDASFAKLREFYTAVLSRLML